MDLCRAAAAGRARLVLRHRGAGLGKTRLVEEFRDWCARRGAVVARRPLLLRRGPAGLRPGGGLAARRTPCARGSRSWTPARLPSSPACCPSCSTRRPDTRSPSRCSADEHAPRLFDAVADAVHAPRRPVLLVVDDLHTSTGETCRLVHYLLRARARRRGCWSRPPPAARSRPRPPAAGAAGRAARARPVHRDRAGPRSTGPRPPRWAAGSAGAPLDAAARRLHAETEGNPLFVVEALRAGWPSGRAGQPAGADGDRGPAGRSCAGPAGSSPRRRRRSAASSASTCSPRSADARRGRAAGRPRRAVAPADPARAGRARRYDFSHDQLREVAALGVSPARRRLLHLRIAPALDSARRRSRPGQLPDRRALRPRPARPSRPSPGTGRGRRGRTVAARERRRRRAPASGRCDQLRTLPPARSRDAAELELHDAVLLAPLASIAGYVARRARGHQQEAPRADRGAGVPDAPQLLRSLAMSALTAATSPPRSRIGAQLQAAGERRRRRAASSRAPTCWAMAAFWQADFAGRAPPPRAGRRRYRPADRRAHLAPATARTRRCAASLGWATRCGSSASPAAARRRRARPPWTGRNGSRTRSAPASRSLFGSMLALDMDDRSAPPPASWSRGGLAEAAADPAGPPTRWPAYLAVLDGGPGRGLAAIRSARTSARRTGRARPPARRDPGPHPAGRRGRRRRRGRQPGEAATRCGPWVRLRPAWARGGRERITAASPSPTHEEERSWNAAVRTLPA